jgi:hypothetical protein
MAEYPTSIRLTTGDKKRLRKHAARWQLSLAGLIQMVLLQWLEVQDKPSKTEETQRDEG